MKGLDAAQCAQFETEVILMFVTCVIEVLQTFLKQ